MILCCVIVVLALILAIVAIVKVQKAEKFAPVKSSMVGTVCPPGYPSINYPVSDEWIKYCTEQVKDNGVVTAENAPCLCAQSYSFLDTVSV